MFNWSTGSAKQLRVRSSTSEQIETELQNRIKAALLGNSCLDRSLESSTQPSTSQMASNGTDDIAQGIGEFSAKWDNYFKRLNSLASESQIEAAIQQTANFQLRMKKLRQETRNRSLCATIMQFNPSNTFGFVQSHLGELVELSNNFDDSQKKRKNILNFKIENCSLTYSVETFISVIRIQETPSYNHLWQ